MHIRIFRQLQRPSLRHYTTLRVTSNILGRYYNSLRTYALTCLDPYDRLTRQILSRDAEVSYGGMQTSMTHLNDLIFVCICCV